MASPIRIAFFLVLLCAILPHSILVPAGTGSAIVVTGYAVFGPLAAVYWYGDGGIYRTARSGLGTIYPIGLLCLGVIVALQFTHVFLGNFDTVTNAVSGLIVPAIVVFNLVYVPRTIPSDLFLRSLAVIAALLTVVGVVAHVTVAAGVVPATILWPDFVTVPVAGTEVRPLRSVVNNPNVFGQIAFVGAVASLVSFDRGDRPVYGLFTIVAVLGLLASFSRASLVSAAVAIFVYVAYTYGGRRALLAALALLTIAVGAGLALLPTLNRLGFQITFTGRVQLWNATVEAIARRPLLGYGLGATNEMIAPFVDRPLLTQYGPHNSYLRMVLQTGVIGGAAYLVLLGWAFLKHLGGNRIDGALVAIGVGFLVNQLFEEYTMFDPTVIPIVMTIVFGYLLVGEERSRPGARYRPVRRPAGRSIDASPRRGSPRPSRPPSSRPAPESSSGADPQSPPGRRSGVGDDGERST